MSTNESGPTPQQDRPDVTTEANLTKLTPGAPAAPQCSTPRCHPVAMHNNRRMRRRGAPEYTVMHSDHCPLGPRSGMPSAMRGRITPRGGA